jgi:hypothetical protein
MQRPKPAYQPPSQALASHSRWLTIPITTTSGSGSVQRGLSTANAAAAGLNVCKAADKRYSFDVTLSLKSGDFHAR